MMFSNETLWWNLYGEFHPTAGNFETAYKEKGNHGQVWQYVVPAIRSWRLFHFHDTSRSAYVKQIQNINDNEYLREDARNLAAPFFGDFYLRPTTDNKEKIQLEWTEQGEDDPFPASALSDGTLRFICLSTVFLQPARFMPATILIDEPELSLHPYAISVLASMMQSAAYRHQLIVSTQSVGLVNEFSPEDLIIVEKHQGASTFKRPDRQMLVDWLDDYTLGELWKKNLLGGRP